MDESDQLADSRPLLRAAFIACIPHWEEHADRHRILGGPSWNRRWKAGENSPIVPIVVAMWTAARHVMQNEAYDEASDAEKLAISQIVRFCYGSRQGTVGNMAHSVVCAIASNAGPVDWCRYSGGEYEYVVLPLSEHDADDGLTHSPVPGLLVSLVVEIYQEFLLFPGMVKVAVDNGGMPPD